MSPGDEDLFSEGNMQRCAPAGDSDGGEDELGKFYNTAELEGLPLDEARGRARSQELLLLSQFRRQPDRPMTREDAGKVLGNHVPLTSAGRALFNLTEAGFIEKLPMAERRTDGRYGMQIHSWRLRR